MSSVGSVGTFAKHYLTVVCPCGRPLRAKVELAGSEISCWECHKRVSVPRERATTAETIGALRAGWNRVFSAEMVGVVLLAAVVVTGLMCVVNAGIPLALVAIVVIAVGYGELIRRDGFLGSSEPEPVERSSRSPWVQGAAALVLGLCLWAPFLLSPQGVGSSARIVGTGWLAVAAGTLFVPLVMLALFGRDRSGRLGARNALRAAVRHPLAMLAALAIVPLAAVLLEGLLVALTRYFDTLGYLLGDFFPQTEAAGRLLNNATYSLYAPGASSEPSVLNVYLHQLSHGYSLLGAIPPSLSLRMARSAHQISLGQPDTQYFLFRVAATLLSATVMLLALALQARWLGLIASLEATKQPVSIYDGHGHLAAIDLDPIVRR